MKNKIIAFSGLMILAVCVLFTACGAEKNKQQFVEKTEYYTKMEPHSEVVTRVVEKTDESGEKVTEIEYDITVKTEAVVYSRVVTVPAGQEQSENGKEPQQANGEKQSAAKKNAETGTAPTSPDVTSIQKGKNPPSLLSISSPVKNGSYLSLITMGRAGAKYILTLSGSEEQYTATADANGIASWSVPANDVKGIRTATVSDGESSLSVSFMSE